MSCIAKSPGPYSAPGPHFDLIEPVVLTTIEHLRQSGITTPVGVSEVLSRARQILARAEPTPLPDRPPGGEVTAPETMGDCPNCVAAGVTFQSVASEAIYNGAQVTRIALACVTPGCGFVEH